jgi:hypothetical protein
MVRSNVGGHSSLFEQVASPSIAPAWSRVRDDLNQCLLGNSRWTSIVNSYLDELESGGVSGVALSVFNPLDLTMGLFKVKAEASFAYLPTLQVLREPTSDGALDGIVGSVTWDGSTIRLEPQEMLNTFFEGDIFNYFLTRTVHEVWQVEDDLLAWHGLECSVVELSIEKELETKNLTMEGDRLTRESRSADEPFGKSFADFVSAHEEYLDGLEALIKYHSIGL